jgi:hypothetical protein
MSSFSYTHTHRECDDCNQKGPGIWFEDRGTPVYFVCQPCASYLMSPAAVQAAIEEHKEKSFTRMENERRANREISS